MKIDEADMSYEEKLKYIKEAYGYDDQQMIEYEKDVEKRAMMAGYLAPEMVLSFDYYEACCRVKKDNEKKLIEQKKENERLKEEKRKRIEKAKMMKNFGKVYNSGTSFTDKMDNFILWMKENKRKCKVLAKVFARDESVKSAAKTVVNNPSIAMTLAGLITMYVSPDSFTSISGAIMFGAGAGHLYGKLKNIDKEEENNKNNEKSKLDNGQKNDVLDEKAEKNILNMLSKMKDDQKGG